LSQAFSSPSGKLTISPELSVPEPSDPTALLLQNNVVQTLSERIRNCKANAAFFRGSVSALRTFTAEQEQARGNFPGPVPVVYCGGGGKKGSDDDDDDGAINMSEVAEAGAEGILVQVFGGKELAKGEELSSSGDSAWIDAWKAATECGLQPVPEITFGEQTVADWTEDDVTALIEGIATATGSPEDQLPVCVLLSVNPADIGTEEDDSGTVKGEQHRQQRPPEAPVAIPPVPKALGRKVPILGSIRTPAGENRLSIEAQRFKDSGFTGALLRSECLPGFRVQLDLEIVSQFWASVIDDLKSVKSKSFSFRSKNNMEKNMATQWGNYQKSVLESGALGDPEDSYSMVDSAAGEYKGFA